MVLNEGIISLNGFFSTYGFVIIFLVLFMFIIVYGFYKLNKIYINNLQQVRNYDILTGFLSEEGFKYNILKGYETNKNIVIACIDVNEFSTVNDTFGYDIGQQVIIQIANTIDKAFDSNCVLARADSDRFFLAFTYEKLEEVDPKFSKLFEALKKIVVCNLMTLSFTLGCSLTREDEEPEVSIKKAFISWQYAKKNNSSFYKYDQTMDTFLNRGVINTDFVSSVDEDQEIKSLYMPRINLKTGAIVGVSSHMRITSNGVEHDEDETLRMLQIAGKREKYDLSFLDKVCKDISTISKADRRKFVASIPFGLQTFANESIYKEIVNIIRKNEVSTQNISIAISEEEMLANQEAAFSVSSRLDALGIGFELYNFGGNYGSLYALMNFRAQIISLASNYTFNINNDVNKQKFFDIFTKTTNKNQQRVLLGVDSVDVLTYFKSLNDDLVAEGEVVSTMKTIKEVNTIFECGVINLGGQQIYQSRGLIDNAMEREHPEIALANALGLQAPNSNNSITKESVEAMVRDMLSNEISKKETKRDERSKEDIEDLVRKAVEEQMKKNGSSKPQERYVEEDDEPKVEKVPTRKQSLKTDDNEEIKLDSLIESLFNYQSDKKDDSESEKKKSMRM